MFVFMYLCLCVYMKRGERENFNNCHCIHITYLFFPQTVRIHDGLPYGRLCSCHVCKGTSTLQHQIKVCHNSGSGEHEQCRTVPKQFFTGKAPLRTFYLKKHQRSLTDGDGCGKSLNANSQEKTHELVVTCESNVREETLTETSGPYIHQGTDASEQVYSCSECKKSFWRPSYLKRHRQVVHRGERPYSSDICNKSFPTT